MLGTHASVSGFRESQRRRETRWERSRRQALSYYLKFLGNLHTASDKSSFQKQIFCIYFKTDNSKTAKANLLMEALHQISNGNMEPLIKALLAFDKWRVRLTH